MLGRRDNRYTMESSGLLADKEPISSDTEFKKYNDFSINPLITAANSIYFSLPSAAGVFAKIRLCSVFFSIPMSRPQPEVGIS